MSKDKTLFGVQIVPSVAVAPNEALMVTGGRMTHVENLTTGEAEKIMTFIDSVKLENLATTNPNPEKEEKMEEEKYPECEKWGKVHSDASAILQFLDWKDRRKAKEIHMSYEDLVYEYFDIDSKKLEDERRAMIEAL